MLLQVLCPQDRLYMRPRSGTRCFGRVSDSQPEVEWSHCQDGLPGLKQLLIGLPLSWPEHEHAIATFEPRKMHCFQDQDLSISVESRHGLDLVTCSLREDVPRNEGSCEMQSANTVHACL